jgi:hypothetical protein
MLSNFAYLASCRSVQLLVLALGDAANDLDPGASSPLGRAAPPGPRPRLEPADKSSLRRKPRSFESLVLRRPVAARASSSSSRAEWADVGADVQRAGEQPICLRPPTGRLHLARVLRVYAEHGNRHGPHRSHHQYTTPAKRQRRFPSTFPPPDARPRGTGRNGRGRRVTTEAVDRLFMHVTAVVRDQAGMAGTREEPALRPVKSPALPTQVRILSLPPSFSCRNTAV